MDPTADRLTAEAVEKGFETFVSDFNYYEYYPRKSNARRNSMDIYSYANHLFKLGDSRFTKNQLNTKAQTGSSTNGYVVAMENIGLIRRAAQESGSVVYEIADPKILYAQKQGLSLRR
jgi:hypothetical protein